MYVLEGAKLITVKQLTQFYHKKVNLKSPYRGFYLANSLRDKELKG